MPSPRGSTPSKSIQGQVSSPRSRRGTSRSVSRNFGRDAQGSIPSTPTVSGSASSTPRRERRANGRSENENIIPDSSDRTSVPSTSPGRVRPSISSAAALGINEIELSSPVNYGTPSSMGSMRTPRSGFLGTPVRQRVDLQGETRVRTVNIDSEEQNGTPSDAAFQDEGSQRCVIWGTDIVLNECKAKFRRFVQRFINPEAEKSNPNSGLNFDEPFYLQKLKEIHTLEEPFLDLDCEHLSSFESILYEQLINFPQEVIPAFDMVLNEMYFEMYPESLLKFQIQVRPFNVKRLNNMRSLGPEDIDHLITIRGVIVRVSNIMPEMREALFRCSACNYETIVQINRGRIAEPTFCTNCTAKYSFQLIHNRSGFSDKQMLKLQETTDDSPSGQVPSIIVLIARNTLVDVVQGGDRVSVTGIYRARPIQLNPRMRTISAIFRLHIDVLHFQKLSNEKLHRIGEGKKLEFTEEREKEFKELSQKDDLYDRLTSTVAPLIHEHDDIKKGLLLQLFGGTKKNFETSGRKHFRADINILLCGDPGTSKSQLLRYVYKLLPRSQYTSGKGSSAVGLTAYISKDVDTKQLVLNTGALVLADNGVCCIDEFDKMNDSTRSILHEVMEQQTLSIAKAGIICQLNARTSILAAANPTDSQWNKNRTIIDNIRLPHTLMSRFDLIFIMLDPHNEIHDKRLAEHLVSLYFNKVAHEEDDSNRLLLRDYLAYAKENVHPKLTNDSKDRLINTYVEMRRIGSGRGQISAYPRQLESLIRLSEAHAKMRLSETVDVQDVDEAYRLHREALKQSATDPLSGKIDVTILTTGVSNAARKKKLETCQALKTLILSKGKTGGSLSTEKLMTEFKERSEPMITREAFDDALRCLEDEGIILIINKNSIRIQN